MLTSLPFSVNTFFSMNLSNIKEIITIIIERKIKNMLILRFMFLSNP